VQAGIDPHHRAAFLGKCAGLRRGGLPEGQARVDLAVAVQVFRFSGAEIKATYMGRPSELRPNSCSLMRSLAAASFWK
jgi:hypothetical protein